MLFIISFSIGIKVLDRAVVEIFGKIFAPDIFWNMQQYESQNLSDPEAHCDVGVL